MSTPLATPVPTVAPTVPAAPSAARASGGWLLGSILDSLFIANLAWPAVAAFAMLATQTVAYQTFGYLLAYFIIMPHRWITLPLVFGDRQRLAQRPLAYLAVLAAVVVSCGVVKLSMASLAVLVAADYLWTPGTLPASTAASIASTDESQGNRPLLPSGKNGCCAGSSCLC